MNTASNPLRLISLLVAIALLITLLTLPASARQESTPPGRQRAPDVATGEESVPGHVMIRGSVVDADENTLSGAEVLVFTRPPFPGEKQFEMEPIAQSVTGPDGSFEVTIKQGSFAVTARAEGMLAYEAFGGKTGDRDGIEGMVVRLRPIARATGCVLDPDGQPVAGQLVRFSRSYGIGADLATGYEEILRQARGRSSVTTDEHGRFEITSPAGIDYQVTVSSPFAEYRESHEVTEGAEILLQLDAGEVASGKVFLADGQPAAGAVVHFHAFQHSRRTTTDATGRFEIRGIHRYDRSYITVHHQDAAVFCLQPVPQDTSDLVLQLEQGQIIEGRVVDADGNGIEGARVKAVGERVIDPLARHVGIKKYTWEWANRRDETTSGKDGRFRFANLYSGPFEVTAALERLDIGAVTKTAKTGDGDVEIKLSPASMERTTLQLRVLGQSAGEPVPQAKVRISPAGGGRWRDLITDNNGHAEAVGFDPGDYIVTIDHAGFALGRERVTLRRGKNDVRIELVAPVDVELRLRTTSGQVIPNASVGLKRANGELFGFPVGGQKVSEKLLQNGVVKLNRVPAEVVTLLVDRQGEARVEQPLDLRVESGSVIDVWLNPPPSAGMVMILVAVVIVISISGWIALRPRKS